MGNRPHVLFDCLQADLSTHVHGLDYALSGRRKHEFWPGIRVDQVASIQLLKSILKKYQGKKTQEADKLALDKFLLSNQKCDRENAVDDKELTEIQAVALGETKKCLYDFFFTHFGEYVLDTDKVCSGMRTGPGSSLGAVGDSFYQKVACSPLTGTSKQLLSLYRRECAKFSLWSETEKIRSDHMGDFVQVDSNSLSYVPKTADVSRTICTEPLLNMLVQQGVASVLTEVLRERWNIDLSTQPELNSELARIGSLTGEFGTIDLSSASDTISLALCRELLPPYIMGWLSLCRSPNTLLPNGKKVQLHMVSSMGNAFTFPLQTILFSSVVIGCYRALGIKRFNNSMAPVPTGRKDSKGRDSWELRRVPGNWGVFGDDIIVRREAYDLVVNLLERLGFSVNLDKSYNIGPFRESCGSDFWNGVDVRGIYCQRLDSSHDCYSLINRLVTWSSNHGIPLPLTLRYLLGTEWTTSFRHKGKKISKTRKLEFLPIPPWENENCGIRVPESLLIKCPKKEAKGLQGSYLYTRYQPRALSFSLLDLEHRPLKHNRGWNNPAGVLLAAVGGYLRDGRVVERQRHVHYKKRLAIAPSWDYRNPSHSNLTNEGWQRFIQDVARISFVLD